MIKEEVKVHNTLTGKKEAFITQKAGKVGMYVCGPTTYNFIHLGNARPIVVFDTIRRYLEYIGYDVTYILNFTDVDDKIIKRSKEEGFEPLELAAKYIEEYYKDADSLHVKRASIHPKVSEHIDDIIEFVQELIEKGYAYEINGDVYYDVTKFDSYGKLSKRTLDDLQAGARVEVNEDKKHAGDFALWKKAKEGEPSWLSPWGQGRPGWHIECSAMSHKYLGKTFDIHGGGFDLIFPHHENEIAQSEARYGTQMAKYWLHNGFITVNEEKMSKSLGNFFLLREIMGKFPANVIRFYLLSTHYRSQLDFDDNKLKAAQKGLERLMTAYRLLEETKGKALSEDGSDERARALLCEVNSIKRKFMDAMNDDFNTALAIAEMFDFAKAINIFVSSGITNDEELKALNEVGKTYLELAEVLGLSITKTEENTDEQQVDDLMNLIIKIRQEAKKKKDYATADLIRDDLKELGIILEDTSQGSRWRYQ